MRFASFEMHPQSVSIPATIEVWLGLQGTIPMVVTFPERLDKVAYCTRVLVGRLKQSREMPRKSLGRELVGRGARGLGHS